MLTQASDYLYYTPIADGIHGQPMPVRTGAAKSVVKYEDIVYLAEMAAERGVWCTGDAVNPRGLWTNLTNAASPVLKRGDLARIQDLARYIWDREYFSNGGWGIPADWNAGLGAPIVGAAAYNAWIATSALPPYTGANCSFVESVGDYDELFAYFDAIKRYVFQHDNLVSEFTFVQDADIANALDQPILLTQVGNATITYQYADGSSQSMTTPDAVAPYFQMEYGRKTGSTSVYETNTVSCAAQGGYKLYVHTPFARNRLTNALYAASPVVYLRFRCGIMINSYDDPDYYYDETIPVVLRLGTLSSPTNSSFARYPIYFAFTKDNIMMPLTQTAYNALVDWANTNVPDFDLQGTKRIDVYVTLDCVYYDTGVIAHCSNLQA